MINILKKILIVLCFATSSPAQILECLAIENPKMGLQIAKLKFEKLKSKNGTEYIRAGYNNKYDFTIFSAVTKLGIEKIFLHNKSTYNDNIEIFKAFTSIEFTNGMYKEIELTCYDLIQMNKKRLKEGYKTSTIEVEDY